MSLDGDASDDDLYDTEPNESQPPGRRSSTSLRSAKWSIEEDIVCVFATNAANETCMAQRNTDRLQVVNEFYVAIMTRFDAENLWDTTVLRSPLQPKTPQESIEYRRGSGEAIDARARKTKRLLTALVPEIRRHYKGGQIPSGWSVDDHWNATLEGYLATFNPVTQARELKSAKLLLRAFTFFCPQSPFPVRAGNEFYAHRTLSFLSLMTDDARPTARDTLNRAQQRAGAKALRAAGYDPKTRSPIEFARASTSPPPRPSPRSTISEVRHELQFWNDLWATSCLGLTSEDVQLRRRAFFESTSRTLAPPAPEPTRPVEDVQPAEDVCEHDDVAPEFDNDVEHSIVAVEARADEEDHDRAAVEEHEPVVDVPRPVSPSDAPTQRASSPSPPPAKRARSIEEAASPVRSSPRPHRAPTKLTT